MGSRTYAQRTVSKNKQQRTDSSSSIDTQATMPPLKDNDLEMQNPQSPRVRWADGSTGSNDSTMATNTSPQQEHLIEMERLEIERNMDPAVTKSPPTPQAVTSVTSVKAVAAATLYCFCSVSMVLVNKSLASSYKDKIDGDVNILLVVFQATIAVVSVHICKVLSLVEYPDIHIDTARAWAPVNIFFCLMLFTGMASLQTNSVPMVTVFKNVTNVLTAAGDYFVFDNRPELFTIAAFGVMLVGAVAAAINDIQISPVGLFWMVANCVTTAAYVLYMKFATQNVKIPVFGMVFINNVLCIGFLLPVAYVKGEIFAFLRSDQVHTLDYFARNAFAGLVGFFLNFASLNCVSITGPTTYAIVGSLNKIPIALLGYILFNDVITQKTWFFIGVSMVGGFLYSYAKIQSDRQKASSRHIHKA